MTHKQAIYGVFQGWPTIGAATSQGDEGAVQRAYQQTDERWYGRILIDRCHWCVRLYPSVIPTGD